MMMAYLFAVGLGSVIALSDWRMGLAVAIILDCVRDPIRKMLPGEPTLVSFVICLIWGAAFVRVFFGGDRTLMFVRSRFPWIQKSMVLVVIGLIPGAMLSIILYQNGFLLAGLGSASYAAPLIGLALGAAFVSEPKRLNQLMKLYVIVNSIALTGCLAEWNGWDWPALGGMEGFNWIRYIEDGQVNLISGFFRSPDMAGFHAANAMMVSAMLILRTLDMRRKLKVSPLWMSTLVWCSIPLILCGRRKMMIIPVVFVVAYLLYLQLATSRKVGPIVGFMFVITLMTGLVLSIWRDEDSLQNHQAYVGTTVTDAVPRLQDNVIGGVATTLRQSGMFGSGLGVATQGAQHLSPSARRKSRAWQEDGVSRLFKELGVPGVLFITFAAFILSTNCLKAIKAQRYVQLQDVQAAAFSVVMGNGASFVISHQHFSGDPANALWVLLFGGVFVGTLAMGIATKRREMPTTSVHRQPAKLARGI